MYKWLIWLSVAPSAGPRNPEVEKVASAPALMLVGSITTKKKKKHKAHIFYKTQIIV